MAPDSRFFPPQGPFSAADLSSFSGAELVRSGGNTGLYLNVAALGSATDTDVSFLDNKLYKEQLGKTEAGCCVVRPDQVELVPEGSAVLSSDNPYLAYARIATAFHPGWDDMFCPAEGTAPVHSSAKIGVSTTVGNGAIVGPKAEIGDNCTIGPNAYIGEGVQIGDNSRIGPNASIRYAVVGRNVAIYAGARIGEPGFGFAVSESGPVSVPQVGRVIIGDDVEVGANTTIDRGAAPDTVIGPGTRIDNLVQIGHNVEIGRMCIVVAQVGIAGSTIIGQGVQIGGQTAISGHLTIGDGARIAACSGVMRNIPPGETVAGIPAITIKQFFRQTAAVTRLAQKKDS